MALGDGKTEGDGKGSPFGDGRGGEGARAMGNDFVTNPEGNAPRTTGNDFVTRPEGTAGRGGPKLDVTAQQGPKAPTGDPKDLDQSSIVPGSGPSRVPLADVGGERAKFIGTTAGNAQPKPFKNLK